MDESKVKKKKITTIKDTMMQEISSYCDKSSVIGANYFFSDISRTEKTFWIISVIVMLVAASIEINLALIIWNQNPTVTQTDSVSSPVTSIQFPTLTICPDFLPDKTGFVSNMLNLLKFQCNGQENCQSYNDTVEDARRYLFDMGDYTEDIFSFIQQYANTSDYDINNIDILTLPIMQEYSNLGDTNLIPLMKKKLSALLNNYDVYDYLNVSEEGAVPTIFYADNISWTDAMNYRVTPLYQSPSPLANLTILIYLILALPLPGPYGTVHFNFHYIATYPDSWFCGQANDDLLDPYLDAMLSGIVKSQSPLLVSPSEISAILNVVADYVDIKHAPFQFPKTVRKNINQSEPDKMCTSLFDDPPEFFSVENYFGKMLGPHLEVVMEVMFLCLLRVQPITKDRFIKSSIYGGIENIMSLMPFPVDFEERFYPKWEHFQTFNRTPYFWTTKQLFDNDTMTRMDFKIFENKRDQAYNPMQEISASPLDDVIEELRGRYQYQQMLSVCNGPGSNRTCYDQFKPVLTDSGICYAFNALDFNSAVVNNTYIDMFRETFLFGHNTTTDIVRNEKYGKSFQMFIILDSHQSKVYENEKGIFKLGINDMYGFMNVRDIAIEVEVGFNTKVTLVPTQMTTSDAFRQHHISVRGCRYLDENPKEDSLFQFYSQESCTFECGLKHSTQACGCTPWNYPQYGSGEITEICDGVKSYCFEQQMGQYNKTECECLPDCEQVSFAVTSDKSVINYESECSFPTSNFWTPDQVDVSLNTVVAEKIRHMEGEEYLYWYNRLIQPDFDYNLMNDILPKGKYVQYLDPRITQDKCLQLLENDFAILSIEVSVLTMTSLEQDMAVDFFTKISNVGGTLGLFTGMGILSFVKIVFLFYKIARIVSKPVGKQQAKK